jgi:hypothetical protein
MLAGGVGFALMTIGFSLFAIAGTAIIVALFIGGIMGLIERSGESTRGFGDWISLVIADYWWVALIVAVVGVLVWLAGYFASVRILKSSGNDRATAITWSGLGISVAASWVLNGILSIGGSFAGVLPGDDGMWQRAALVASIVGGVLGLVAMVAVGVFAWWWMAHAFRARSAASVG